jgi:toxin ParE1/3/4
VSEAAATRFVQAIETAFEPVRHFPHAGPSRDFLCAGLRVTFHDRYAIYYLARQGEIVIVRVVHGARDISNLIDPGDFP